MSGLASPAGACDHDNLVFHVLMSVSFLGLVSNSGVESPSYTLLRAPSVLWMIRTITATSFVDGAVGWCSSIQDGTHRL